MRKQILTVLALICSGVTMIASAADFTVNKLKYNIISPEAQTVEAVENSSASGAVTIPETVTYDGVTYTVVQIASQAFDNATAMTSVSIPSTITTIGNKAFNGCTGLTSISYNATDCSIMGSADATAFYGCISVKTVSIGDAVRTIPAYAFKGLTALRSITIPENITYMGNYAFQGCTSIAQVNFNATECNSMAQAFDVCTNTANLYIGNNVKVIPPHAFDNFTGLTSITIGESVISIGHRAFYNCYSLKKVNYNAIACEATDGTAFMLYNSHNTLLTTIVIGDNVKIIPAKLFYGNNDFSKISSITWGKSIEEIQDYAFYGSDMSSITIPSTVKKIGNNAFANNEFLKEVKFNEGLTYLSGFNECDNLASINIPSTVEVIGNDAFSMCKAIQGELKLPAGLKSIYSGAFHKCTGITGTLVIPDNTVEIYNHAFYNNSIISLKLGKSVKTISNNAFYDCTALSGELYLPESIQTIDYNAFYNTGISGKLTLPKSLTRLGENAFQNCANLTSVHQKSVLGTSYSCSHNGYFAGCPNITEVTFEKGIKEVYAGLCNGLTKITSVTIPEGVEAIGQYAFHNCTALTNVSLPSTLQAIWTYAFSNCSYLDNVELPEGLKNIAKYAFENCNSLKSITIPESLESLGYSAFANCNNMTSATFNAIQCETINIPYFPTAKLTKMTIGENVEIVPEYILYSSSVKVVEWNAKAVRVYNDQNYGAYGGNKASPVSIIGEDVTTFYGLNSPTVISYAEVPPTLYNIKNGATVYVPNAFAYQTNAEWAKYTICQSVTWKGTTDGETLSYTTNFPYELTLKEYQTRDGKKMETTPCTIGDYQAVFTYMIDDMPFEMVSKFSITANTSNTIYTEPTKAYRGREMEIPFKMINDREFTAFQCDIHFPAGVNPLKDEYGDYIINYSDRKSNTHTISAELQTDGSIRVTGHSSKNYAFKGNEGDLFYMNVAIANDATVGEKTLAITNIRLSEIDANEVITNRNESAFEILDLVLGDSNDDMSVTMGDVVNIVNYVLGDIPAKFVFAASDINGDQSITMADVVMTVNAVLNGGVVVKPKASLISPKSTTTEANYSIGASDILAEVGATATLYIDMSNSTQITSFQFDMKLPEGISIPTDEYGDPEIFQTNRATNTHSILTSYQADGSLRVVSYSAKSRPFSGNSGDICEITLKFDENMKDGIYELEFYNIGLVQPDGTEFKLEPFKKSINLVPTAIENVDNATEFNVYGGKGKLDIVSSSQRNIVVYNAMGVAVKSLSIEAGNTTVELPAGLYIVEKNKVIVK